MLEWIRKDTQAQSFKVIGYGACQLELPLHRDILGCECEEFKDILTIDAI